MIGKFIKKLIKWPICKRCGSKNIHIERYLVTGYQPGKPHEYVEEMTVCEDCGFMSEEI